MRLRVHDDGRIALQTPAGEWIGMDSPHQATWPEPGWRELVVLDPKADAQRLAEASVPDLYGHSPEAVQRLLDESARDVLGRLVAGTEGERG